MTAFKKTPLQIAACGGGFHHGLLALSYLETHQAFAVLIGLADWMVPSTTYWLYVDGLPVGIGKLRHYLTDKLREEGGHCGYAIRPSCRSKGYGKLLLNLLIKKARSLGIERLLLTIQNHNIPSIKVALFNGGVIERVNEQRHYIWLECRL